MTKKEKELRKREAEVEAREREVEDKLFDAEFLRRQTEKVVKAAKAASAPKGKAPTNPPFGKNSKGIVVSSNRDKIRPVDSYPDSYYRDSESGNKRIVKFFAENPGKAFSGAEIRKGIGSKRFDSDSARSYFIRKKTIRKVIEGDTVRYTGVFFSE